MGKKKKKMKNEKKNPTEIVGFLITKISNKNGKPLDFDS